MGLGTSLLGLAKAAFKSLDNAVIKTTAKLGAKDTEKLAGKELAKEIATSGGKVIAKDELKNVASKTSNYVLKDEFKNWAGKAISASASVTKPAIYVATGGLAVYGLSKAGEKSLENIKQGWYMDETQAKQKTDVDTAKELQDILAKNNELQQKQYNDMINLWKDYNKNSPSGDVSFDYFLNELNKAKDTASNSTGYDLINSGNGENKTSNNSYWLYGLGALALVGGGYYLYKKGKKSGKK